MPKFRKKPVVIEATQWFKHGGHKAPTIPNARIVGDYRCEQCRKPLTLHGLIKTLEGEMMVCPGDWIITGIQGEHYPCKPDIFEATYEPLCQHGNVMQPLDGSVGYSCGDDCRCLQDQKAEFEKYLASVSTAANAL